MELSVIAFVLIILFVFSNIFFTSGSFSTKLKNITQAYEEEKYDVAMKIINNLDTKYRKDSLILWISANINLKQQQYILAMVNLQNILECGIFNKDVKEIEVREMLAFLYEETGNTKKAIDEYEIIVKLDDQNYDALYKAGKNCYKHGEYASSQKYLSLAAKINDTNPELFFMLSDSFYKLKSYHAASQNIQKSIALDSVNPYYHFLYGKILYAERNYNSAATELELAYNSDINEKDEILLFLGNTYYELLDYNKARDYYSKVLDKEDTFGEKVIDERYKYAETLVKNKQFEAAVNNWTIIKSLRSIYLDVESKVKTYATIINNSAFRLALEMDIIEYLEKHLYRILTLNGYVVTEHFKRSSTLIFFVTIKKFGTDGQSYKTTFALDTSGHSVLQDTMNEFLEYNRTNKSAHAFFISIGGFANNIKCDIVELIEPERFEAIMEGVISFSN